MSGQKSGAAKKKGLGQEAAANHVCRLNLPKERKKEYREADRKTKAGLIKTLLLNGFSRHEISEETSIPYSTVRNISEDLVRDGRLVRYGVKGCVPLYEDPLASARDYKGMAGRLALITDGTDGVILPRLKKGRACPPGYVDLHVSFGVDCKLRSVGDFDEMRTEDNYVVGEWTEHKASKANNLVTHTGYVRVFGDNWWFTYYDWGTGSKRFTMKPVRALIKVEAFDRGDEQESLKAMVQAAVIDRCNYVIEHFLKPHGWQMDPQFPDMKLIHAAREGDELAKYIIPKSRDPEADDNDVIVDNSPGYPEAEIEGMEGLESFSLTKIFANVPGFILALKHAYEKLADNQTKTVKFIENQFKHIGDVLDVLGNGKKVIENVTDMFEKTAEKQTSVISQITERVSALGDSSLGITKVQSSADGLIASNARAIEQLAVGQGQMTSMVSRLCNPGRFGRRI